MGWSIIGYWLKFANHCLAKQLYATCMYLFSFPAGASEGHLNGSGDGGPSSPQSGDSNCNVASSSHCMVPSLAAGSITPSISLIPIKQVCPILVIF